MIAQMFLRRVLILRRYSITSGRGAAKQRDSNAAQLAARHFRLARRASNCASRPRWSLLALQQKSATRRGRLLPWRGCFWEEHTRMTPPVPSELRTTGSWAWGRLLVLPLVRSNRSAARMRSDRRVEVQGGDRRIGPRVGELDRCVKSLYVVVPTP